METSEAAPEARRAARGHSPAQRWAFWGAAAAVLAADQATKIVVRTAMDRGEAWPSEDWAVRIKYVTNSGAAFGILQGETLFLTVMALVGLAAIYLYYRFPPFDHWLASLGIGLMLGGALGNLADRVLVGRVTDFIDFPRFPAFNLADTSINIGVAIIILGFLLLDGRRETPAPSDADG